MKSNRIFMVMLVAASFVSCTASIDEKDTAYQIDNAGCAKTVKVTASMGDDALTRTSMIDVADGFSFTWTAGDKLSIQEIIPQVRDWQRREDFEEFYDYVAQTYNTRALPANCTTASWDLLLEDRPALHYAPVSTFQYFAVYPDDNRINCWNEWDEDRDAPILYLSFPESQRPTQTCFDPDADILVSKMITCQGRPDNLDFEFARVGTITKIVCKKLTPGSVIYGGEVELDYMCTGFFGYLPLSQKLTQVDGNYYIYLDFNGTQTVSNDGTFTIWLRHNSGSARRVKITLYGYDDDSFEYHKTIKPKTGYIKFREGGMTSFTTDMTPPDVFGPDENDLVYEGAIEGQTLKAIWPGTAHAIGYTCELVNQETKDIYELDVTNNNDGTWSASGTAPGPGYYILSVSVIADESHIADSNATEKHFEIIPGGCTHEIEINYMMFPHISSTDIQHVIYSQGGFVFDYIGLRSSSGYSADLHGSENEGSEGWKIWNASSLYDISSIEVNYDSSSASDHTGVLMVSKYPDRDFVTVTPTTNGYKDIYDLSDYDCSYFRFVPSSSIDDDNSTIYRGIDFKSLEIISLLP